MTCKDCDFFVRCENMLGIYSDGICARDDAERDEKDPACYEYKRGDDTFYNRIMREVANGQRENG